MNAERLLAHFEQISEAPDAVARLRRFILDLAVRGKLVEQESNDAKPHGLKEQNKATAPFDLPGNWTWIRIGDQLNLVNGMAFKSTDWRSSGLPIVRIQNLNNTNAAFNHCDPCVAREKSLIDNGSFLISWSGTPGTSFGAFIWDRGPAVLNQHIFRCDFKTQLFVAPFLKLAINGRLDEIISKAHGGVGLQHITKGKLEALLIPLPPLAEQHRIVAKVDELMALCDQLEASHHQREQQRERLVAASLQRLNQPAEDPETSRNDARFALQVLPSLTATPAQIKQLRQTILNLAVRGKLVEQERPTEERCKFLEAIKADQLQALRAKRIKPKVAALSSLSDVMLIDNSLLPENVSLASIIVFGPQNGISPPEVSDPSAPKALTLSATTSGAFDPKCFKHVSLAVEACEPYWLSSGDLLFQRGNTREYVGMAAVYEGPDRSFVYPDLMIRVRVSKQVSLRYVHMVLVSPDLRAYFTGNATGSSETMPKINQEVLLNAPIPLPPLAEQHRIVAKVEELMAVCNQLEQQLSQADQQRRRLLEAVLAEALVEPEKALVSLGST